MAKKRNTIEDYLNELYRRGMAGDEEAQLEFIQVIVMETAAPLEGAPLEWLNALVEKGNTQARRCYFAWAMNGDAANCDWQRLVQWAEELLVEAPGDAHCMLGMLYEPGLPGLADDKLAEEHYRKALDAGNEGCGFYLARVLLGREEHEELPYAEARELLERAEKSLPGSQRDWFVKTLLPLTLENLCRVKADLDLFVVKNDFRNAHLAWGNARDAVARGMQKLQGGHPADPVYRNPDFGTGR